MPKPSGGFTPPTAPVAGKDKVVGMACATGDDCKASSDFLTADDDGDSTVTYCCGVFTKGSLTGTGDKEISGSTAVNYVGCNNKDAAADFDFAWDSPWPADMGPDDHPATYKSVIKYKGADWTCFSSAYKIVASAAAVVTLATLNL